MNRDAAATTLWSAQGNCLSRRVRLADGWLARLRGLMFTPALPADACLVIIPCQQVHTHFMRYPLDVVFVDRQWRVLRVLRGLRPWRFSPWVRGAHAVIEFAAGGAAGVEIGERLLLRGPGAERAGLRRPDPDH